MALHEANQARSSHYPQWHCGPKLHLLATNDILHLLGISTQQHGRSVHTIICQGNAALFCQGIVLFRANNCQGFETTSAESIFEVTQTNIPALLGWDTSSAREAPWILQRVVDVQCNLQAMLERCHFFEANVVLRLQISFLFHFALQQVSKVLALCSTQAFVAVEAALTLLSAWRSSNSKSTANSQKSQGPIAMAVALVDRTVARGRWQSDFLTAELSCNMSLLSCNTVMWDTD